jgi:hypothetical protein
MATVQNLTNRISFLKEKGTLGLWSKVDSLEELYRRQRPVKLPDGTLRPWGEGPNESFETFVSYVAEVIFGGLVTEWPDDVVSLKTRNTMRALGVNHSELQDALVLVRANEWNRYRKVEGSRSPGSCYQPPSISEFLELVTEGILLQATDARDFSEVLNKKRELPSLTWTAAFRAVQHGYATQKYQGTPGNLVGTCQAETAEKMSGHNRQVVAEMWSKYHVYVKESIVNGRQSSEVLVDVLAEKYGTDVGQINRCSAEEQQMLALRRKPAELQSCAEMRWLDLRMAAGTALKEIWPEFKADSAFLRFLREEGKWKAFQDWDMNRLYAKFLSGDNKELADVAGRIRHGREVVRWLVGKWGNPALTKTRTIYLPAGEVKNFRFVDIIDEIHPEDLANGLATSPEVAFASSAKRLEERARLAARECLPLPKCPLGNEPGIKQLVTSTEVWEEGKTMGHCIGGYAEAALHKQIFLYHIGEAAPKGASAEIANRNGEWVICQVKSLRNGSAEAEESILKGFINKKSKKEV